jgi:hypothetical protein
LFYTPLQPVINFFSLDYNLLVLSLYAQFEKTMNGTLASLSPKFNQISLNTTSISSRPTTFTTLQSLDLTQTYNAHELATDYRFQKTQNPIFRYDFRVGHYMTDVTKVLNRHMFTTFNDVTTGLRRAP